MSPKNLGRMRRLLAGATFLTLGTVAGCAFKDMAPEAKAQPVAGAPTSAVPDVAFPERSVRPPRQDAVGLRTSFADVLEPALDSVVSIEAVSRPRSARDVAPRQRALPFPFPFEMPEGEERGDSYGSGVVVRKDGIILTNNHVVEGAGDVRVRFYDNRELRAKVLGTDPATDIAVLQVDATDLPALTLGTSQDLRVGDVVFAIGSPFALAQSVTMGIVSARGRSRVGVTHGGYEDFIQTDAPINPGNSGGALLDSRGEVIGINTAIFSQGARGNQGIGFAVPVDLARNVMEQILTDGKVVRAQLGVGIKSVDSTLAKSFGLERPMGALVTKVERDSPAEKAGLRAEDLIVEIDGKGVNNDNQLRLDISSRRPGSSIQLAVLRDEDGKLEKRTFDAVLRELKPENGAEESTGDAVLRDEDNALRGLAVDDVDELTPAQRQRLKLSDLVSGVIVTEVEPGSPAQRGGLQAGDVITSLNQQPVSGAAAFRGMAKNAGKGVVRLRVVRGGETDIVALEP